MISKVALGHIAHGAGQDLVQMRPLQLQFEHGSGHLALQQLLELLGYCLEHDINNRARIVRILELLVSTHGHDPAAVAASTAVQARTGRGFRVELATIWKRELNNSDKRTSFAAEYMDTRLEPNPERT